MLPSSRKGLLKPLLVFLLCGVCGASAMAWRHAIKQVQLFLEWGLHNLFRPETPFLFKIRKPFFYTSVKIRKPFFYTSVFLNLNLTQKKVNTDWPVIFPAHLQQQALILANISRPGKFNDISTRVIPSNRKNEHPLQTVGHLQVWPRLLLSSSSLRMLSSSSLLAFKGTAFNLFSDDFKWVLPANILCPADCFQDILFEQDVKKAKRMSLFGHSDSETKWKTKWPAETVKT